MLESEFSRVCDYDAPNWNLEAFGKIYVVFPSHNITICVI